MQDSELKEKIRNFYQMSHFSRLYSTLYIKDKFDATQSAFLDQRSLTHSLLISSISSKEHFFQIKHLIVICFKKFEFRFYRDTCFAQVFPLRYAISFTSEASKVRFTKY